MEEEVASSGGAWPNKRICGNCLLRSQGLPSNAAPASYAAAILFKPTEENKTFSSFSLSHATKQIAGTTTYCLSCKNMTFLVREGDDIIDWLPRYLHQQERSLEIKEGVRIMQKANNATQSS